MKSGTPLNVSVAEQSCVSHPHNLPCCYLHQGQDLGPGMVLCWVTESPAILIVPEPLFSAPPAYLAVSAHTSVLDSEELKELGSSDV